MHNIDGPGATEDNRFTEGSPTLGIPPTMVTADWANAVQEEIVGVIAGAGITLDKADNGQLKDAIEALIAGAAADPATTINAGVVELATNAEAVAGVDAARAVTPAALAAALAGVVRLTDWVELVPERAWKMPNGLIIQIGKTAPLSSGTASANSRTESFPIAFPIGCYSLMLGTVSADTINPNAFAALVTFTASQFTWTADIVVTGSPAANLAASWIAIGH